MVTSFQAFLTAVFPAVFREKVTNLAKVSA